MSDVFRFAESRVQDRSPFFTRFPPEIRRLIYREAFGDRRVHIVPKETEEPGSTSNHHAPQQDVSKPASCRWTHHVCIRDMPDQGDLVHPHHEDKDKPCHLATQILRTCKQAFEEGIHLLYTTNVFAFDGGHSMSDFQATIFPTSLIRCIEVYSNTMVLGDADVKPFPAELDAMEEALEKRQRTPLELRLNFEVGRQRGFDPRRRTWRGGWEGWWRALSKISSAWSSASTAVAWRLICTMGC